MLATRIERGPVHHLATAVTSAGPIIAIVSELLRTLFQRFGTGGRRAISASTSRQARALATF